MQRRVRFFVNCNRMAVEFLARRERRRLEFVSATLIQTNIRARQARQLLHNMRSAAQLAKEENEHNRERDYRRREASALTTLRETLDGALVAHRDAALEALRVELLRRLARAQRREQQPWRLHLLSKGIHTFAEWELYREQQVNGAWELAHVGEADRLLLRDRRTALAKRDWETLQWIHDTLGLQEELKVSLVHRAPGQAAYLFNTLTMEAVWDDAPLVGVDARLNTRTEDSSGHSNSKPDDDAWSALSPTLAQASDDKLVLGPEDRWQSMPCSRHDRHDETSVAAWFATKHAGVELCATHYCVHCQAVYCSACEEALHAVETGSFTNHARVALEYLAHSPPDDVSAVVQQQQHVAVTDEPRTEDNDPNSNEATNNNMSEQKESVAFRRPSGPRRPSTSSSSSSSSALSAQHGAGVGSQRDEGGDQSYHGYFMSDSEKETARRARVMACGRCERRLVEVGCVECAEMLCRECYSERHVEGTRRGRHQSVALPLRSSHNSTPLPDDELECDECAPGVLVTAVRRCSPCGQVYCVPCFDYFHRKGQRKLHPYTLVREADMWKRLFDIEKGRYYFVNILTDEQMWTKPPALMGALERQEYDERMAAEKLRFEAGEGANSELKQLIKRVEELRQWKKDLQDENEYISGELTKSDANTSVGGAVSRARAIMQEGKSAGEAAQRAALQEYMRTFISENDVGIRVDRIKRATYGNNVLSALEDSRQEHRHADVQETAKMLTGKELAKRVLRLRKRFPKDDTVGLGRECAKHGIPFGTHVRLAGDRIERMEALERLAVVEHIQSVGAKRDYAEKMEVAKGHVQINKIRMQYAQKRANEIAQREQAAAAAAATATAAAAAAAAVT
jgi:uncharacterized protein (UPF0335 family)